MSYHDARRRHPHPIQTFRPESEYSSSAPGSGAQTPTGSGASSSQLPGLVSSIWGGLIRRFSAETPSLTHSQSYPADSSHSHFDDHNYNNSNDNNGVDGVYVPPRFHETIQRTASPMQPPPLEPVQLKGFAPDTPASARILTQAIAEEIRIMVPTRLSIVDEWNLVYSLDQDGASLGTLYDKCAKYSGRRVGFVLVVKDAEGGIFGAYLSDFPHPAPKYFGTGECFLWRASVMASLPPPPSADTTNLRGRTSTISSVGTGTDTATNTATNHNSGDDLASCTVLRATTTATPPHNDSADDLFADLTGTVDQTTIRFKAFPYSGVNDYYILCESHFLSVGAGDGKFGLWLDDGLEKGVSSTSQTFGNEQLSDQGEKFSVLGVEVWVIGSGGL
ncbi:oxidation resistance protein 1 [Neurospora crassa]|uniref:Oxidation resistance protein 1 n=1 Tax=Neurospora crassa (strain ATCC 24698 / 74-OR23-1A / CBS 708.71 / DSM 1257 / FGSC 987) TaxID=367110 RepID=OXR1_NEUCR|nr:oxidation resistance protein 1 [Neurospora crassa OR74A]Q7S4P1.2 RecName: Full=Oxidation resistance protein 1 [Neurospora crassa OR74A]EAA30478.2 oxidation resistance protein 1 [Neurospora crassa OR74A]KHE79020.1 oxidation resistance protein 1 [Neurospora crassa]|eukprot:XP_959714.2 oxidation resistance protein 1 [Neurospora crassa OR74A]